MSAVAATLPGIALPRPTLPERVRPRGAATSPLALAVLFGLLFAVAALGMIRETGPFAGWQPTSGALVGRVLLGADGKMTVGELIAAYPPLAVLPMIGLRAPAVLIGVTTGELFSALLGGALAGLWLASLLQAGYRRGTALVLAALLVGNPLFLGALAAGPETALALLGAWVFAMGAFTLRSRGSVNDLITCSGALALLFFAGPLGGAFACATLPFLLLLKPADIPARSAPSIYLVLLFPVIFGLAGFVFVNWMMLHDAFGFLHSDIDLATRRIGQSWRTPVIPVLFAVACAPALVALFVVARGRRPLQAVASALLGTLLLAVTLALQSGACRSPVEALCPAVSLAAAAAMRWPPQRSRPLRVALLLALSLTGGLSALLTQGRISPETGATAAASEFTGLRRSIAEQALGRFLAGRSDVLIDAAAHPAVVAARGGAEGLVTGNDTAFALALLRKRIATRAVAVAAADPSRTEDALSRNLPDLYASGAPGLHLIYDRDGWRVWSRDNKEDPRP